MAPLCFPFLPVCFAIIIIVRHQSFMALIHILSHTVSFFEFHSGFLPLVCFHDWEQQDTSSSSNINVDFCSVPPLLRGCVCLPRCTFICHSCPPILLIIFKSSASTSMWFHGHDHHDDQLSSTTRSEFKCFLRPRHQALERMCLKCEVPYKQLLLAQGRKCVFRRILECGPGIWAD